MEANTVYSNFNKGSLLSIIKQGYYSCKSLMNNNGDLRNPVILEIKNIKPIFKSKEINFFVIKVFDGETEDWIIIEKDMAEQFLFKSINKMQIFKGNIILLLECRVSYNKIKIEIDDGIFYESSQWIILKDYKVITSRLENKSTEDLIEKKLFQNAEYFNADFDNYVRLDQIFKINIGKSINIICCIVDLEEPRELTKKDGNIVIFCKFKLLDESDQRINAIYWGKHALDFKPKYGTIYILNCVKVRMYNQKTVCISYESTITELNININSRRIASLKEYIKSFI